jgi:hypothetical protein
MYKTHIFQLRGWAMTLLVRIEGRKERAGQRGQNRMMMLCQNNNFWYLPLGADKAPLRWLREVLARKTANWSRNWNEDLQTYVIKLHPGNLNELTPIHPSQQLPNHHSSNLHNIA